jgi:hypothetical protein
LEGNNRVYLARKNGAVVHHADKGAMMELDGVEPEREVTDEEFEAAGGLARIIKDKIFLGKTKKEKEQEALRAERENIDRQLADLDKKYLTPRVLAGIGLKDAHAVGQAEKHEAEAVPLRKRRGEITALLESGA